MLNVLSITSSSCCIYESELTETCNVTRCLRVRPAGVGRRAASGDQRSELHPLQDLRHQGPEPEHQLGGAGRRRRSCIQRHVNTTATDSLHFHLSDVVFLIVLSLPKSCCEHSRFNMRYSVLMGFYFLLLRYYLVVYY